MSTKRTSAQTSDFSVTWEYHVEDHSMITAAEGAPEFLKRPSGVEHAASWTPEVLIPLKRRSPGQSSIFPKHPKQPQHQPWLEHRVKKRPECLQGFWGLECTDGLSD